MKNLREIWGQRFIHYVTELQKYMRFVFTGHLAIVFVFTIGAGGYAYSEWLKDIPEGFPTILLTAVLLGMALTLSQPITLLKQADAVYFLPLETKLESYFKRSRNWTFFSQLPIPFIILLVALPLLSATGVGTKEIYIALALVVVFSKLLFVETEFSFRYAREGQGVWIDRLVRFILATAITYTLLSRSFALVAIFILLMAGYGLYWKNKRKSIPFPYDHFIGLEQNRMMRFYRFANYFTDVPHLKGSVSRRNWLGFFMGHADFSKSDAQTYLVKRTFIRTDDTFMLWLRLTVLSALGAYFIPFPILVFAFTGALAFASAVQLIHALRAGDEFRMDLLFPDKIDARKKSIWKIVRTVQVIQTVVVILVSFSAFGLTATPFLIGAVVLIVSEATIRLTKDKEENY